MRTLHLEHEECFKYHVGGVKFRHRYISDYPGWYSGTPREVYEKIMAELTMITWENRLPEGSE